MTIAIPQFKMSMDTATQLFRVFMTNAILPLIMYTGTATQLLTEHTITAMQLWMI